MPSLTYTPGALTLTGGAFNPVPIRFSYTAGRLTLTGGTLAAGVNLTATDGDRLPRLQRQETYFEDTGRPTAKMQLHWQRFAERIERRFDDIESVLAAVQAAQATAAAAVQTANATQAVISLTDSYTDPVSTLTASSDGTVTVAAHSRVYGNGTSVSVNSGTVTGQTGGVTIYYLDPARAGGAVTYRGTASPIAQTGDTHIVGQVTIPAMGEPATTGAGPTAPGYTAPEGGGGSYETQLQ